MSGARTLEDYEAAYHKSVEARQHLSVARDVAVAREREMFTQVERLRGANAVMQRALEDIVRMGHLGPFELSREATVARRALEEQNTGTEPK